MLTRILVFIALVGGTSMLHAQASPTASRAGDLKIGGGWSNANTDYVPNRVNGGTAYVDFDFREHLGIEGEFHFVKDSTTNIYEKSYLIGGRYFRTYKKFVPYGKVMYGRGVFNFAQDRVTTANLAYNMFVGGRRRRLQSSPLALRARRLRISKMVELSPKRPHTNHGHSRRRLPLQIVQFLFVIP